MRPMSRSSACRSPSRRASTSGQELARASYDEVGGEAPGEGDGVEPARRANGWIANASA